MGSEVARFLAARTTLQNASLQLRHNWGSHWHISTKSYTLNPSLLLLTILSNTRLHPHPHTHTLVLSAFHQSTLPLPHSLLAFLVYQHLTYSHTSNAKSHTNAHTFADTFTIFSGPNTHTYTHACTHSLFFFHILYLSVSLRKNFQFHFC